MTQIDPVRRALADEAFAGSEYDGFGDPLYAEGICAPALDVPDDAPREDRLLARMGRAA
ncbi:MAG: hypothetical protein Q7J48_10110 [Nocardioides sp.]|nr:hypothetical protein [Nocardioides sp.]